MVGTMGIWATSLCSLFMTLGNTQAQYRMHNFHLTLECICACSTLCLGVSDHSLFRMGSSHLVVTWWPMFKHSVSTKAQYQTMSGFSSRES